MGEKNSLCRAKKRFRFRFSHQCFSMCFIRNLSHCRIFQKTSKKTNLIKESLELIHDEGKITFKESAIEKWAKTTSYVEQKRDLDLDFPISVFKCVLLGTYPTSGFFRKPGKKEKNQAKKALEKVE